LTPTNILNTYKSTASELLVTSLEVYRNPAIKSDKKLFVTKFIFKTENLELTFSAHAA
jgi:hypothetical protein